VCIGETVVYILVSSKDTKVLHQHFPCIRHVIVCTCCDLLLCIVITQVPEDRTGVFGSKSNVQRPTAGILSTTKGYCPLQEALDDMNRESL
jgi:hypothetical protein